MADAFLLSTGLLPILDVELSRERHLAGFRLRSGFRFGRGRGLRGRNPAPAFDVFIGEGDFTDDETQTADAGGPSHP